MSNLSKVAIVTGASRGAGRGIAIALGRHGCTVYVTGRSEKEGDHSLPGSIRETAEAVTAAGGKGVAVRVDHAKDSETRELIERVERDEGRIDILVNNACAIYDELTATGNFWEKPLKLVDMMDVGLRSGYVATYWAAPLLVKQGKGLVIFTSASGAVHYALGPAYGAHKAGMDKFAADMAIDFKESGVAVLSIWMGALLTERMRVLIESDPAKFGHMEAMLETPEFTGHIIWALANDPELMKMSGQTVIGAEVALRYGIKDADGRQPPSCRETHGVAPRVPYSAIIRP